MYLSIKKKDSVTSILLFIFNIFLVNQGITSVPLKKIFRMLEPFQKNETAIRMGLSRGVQNGLLVNEKQINEVYYRITDEAVRGVKHWQETLAIFRARIPIQLSGWDGKFSILFIESAGEKRGIEAFTESLRKIGYGSLSNTFWISPYDLPGKVEELAHKHKAENFYQFRGGLSVNRKPFEIAKNAWPIISLAERYSLFEKSMKEAASGLDADSYDGGGGLPFLHLHGLELFNIIQDDPQLPLNLLPPDWPGLQAAKAFLDIREQILPKANEYISRILSE
ncbi:MAG: PaaX family transcriptional regulator C-terminal domain-containing protein [Bacillota bacterium]